MKIQLKKCLALLCLALCCFVCMFLMFNSQQVSADVSYTGNTLTITSFKMAEGASVRVGADESDYKTNGIRFSATMSVDDYDSLQREFKDGEIVTGTFIMPYEYYTDYGTFSYETLFGENPTYVWGDAANNKTDNQYKIQHLEGKLHKVEDENNNEFYQLNGSIVNILDQNLDVQLVGVSYVKAKLNGSVYFAFADSDFDVNRRSIVNVSQNGLEKQGENGENFDTFKTYIEKYIGYYKTNNNGEAPKADYTQEIYVKESSGEFVKYEEITVEDGAIEEYNTQVGVKNSAPTRDALTYCSGLVAEDGIGEGVETALLKLDGSTTLKYYYEQTRDNVIWSVDKHNNAKIHTAGLGSGEYYEVATYATNNFNSYLNTTKVNPNSYSYQGERSMLFTYSAPAWGDWFEVNFPHNVAVPRTNKLSMTISNLSDSNYDMYFRIFAGNGTQLHSKNADYTASPQVPMTIEANTYAKKYVFEFNTYFTDVKQIFFYHSKNEGTNFLVHNISYENDLYGANINVPSADTTEMNLKTSDIIKSTIYTDRELNEKASFTSLTYTDLSNSANQFKTDWGYTKAEAQALTAANGIYKAAVTNNTTYSIDATVSMDGGASSVTTNGFIVGHYDMMYATFEEDASLTSGYSGLYGDWGEVALDNNFTYDAPNSEGHGADNASTTANEYNSTTMLSKSHGGIFGANSLIITPKGKLSEKIYQGVRSSKNDRVTFTGKSFNTICFFVYLPTYAYTGLSYSTDVDGYVALTHINVYLHGGTRGGASMPDTKCQTIYMQNMYTSFKPGWNYCEIPLEEDQWGPWTFTGISGITFYNGAASRMTIAIDNIALKAHTK